MPITTANKTHMHFNKYTDISKRQQGSLRKNSHPRYVLHRQILADSIGILDNFIAKSETNFELRIAISNVSLVCVST